MKEERLGKVFFERDVLTVAPDLLGKILVRVFEQNEIKKYKITEIEAYRGEEDLACHASKGRTDRTEVMYHEGGLIYVYLIYGMYWMLNFVTGKINQPQAILIRGMENIDGPGKVSRELVINKSFYGEDLVLSKKIWIENNEEKIEYYTKTRIGIDYSGEYWKNKKWRFILKV